MTSWPRSWLPLSIWARIFLNFTWLDVLKLRLAAKEFLSILENIVFFCLKFMDRYNLKTTFSSGWCFWNRHEVSKSRWQRGTYETIDLEIILLTFDMKKISLHSFSSHRINSQKILNTQFEQVCVMQGIVHFPWWIFEFLQIQSVFNLVALMFFYRWFLLLLTVSNNSE